MMGHVERRAGNLHVSIYWLRNIISIGFEIKWVRKHYVEMWIMLPLLQLGVTYDLRCGQSLDKVLLDPECWEDE